MELVESDFELSYRLGEVGLVIFIHITNEFRNH
jgi:hypothetical protein